MAQDQRDRPPPYSPMVFRGKGSISRGRGYQSLNGKSATTMSKQQRGSPMIRSKAPPELRPTSQTALLAPDPDAPPSYQEATQRTHDLEVLVNPRATKRKRRKKKNKTSKPARWTAIKWTIQKVKAIESTLAPMDRKDRQRHVARKLQVWKEELTLERKMIFDSQQPQWPAHAATAVACVFDIGRDPENRCPW